MTIVYPSPEASLPDAAFCWQDNNGDVIDFSAGWTFELKLGRPPAPSVVTKTAGITGSLTAPNIIVQWAPGELAALTPGIWSIQLAATYTDGRQRIFAGTMKIAAPTLA